MVGSLVPRLHSRRHEWSYGCLECQRQQGLQKGEHAGATRRGVHVCPHLLCPSRRRAFLPTRGGGAGGSYFFFFSP